jgi:class 3 adenylate cyclase/tetratricopeptide (TPR) repeat protein
VSVVCQACRTENPAANKFCLECGQPLARTCTQCGTPYQAGQKFCGECGATVDAAATTVVGRGGDGHVAERRLCSVLFVDLVGFTPLSESRDAEEVRELLSKYFELARTVIARYGGVVEKFIGDAVMAIWGTPVAVEGDAERAVRAALDVVAAVAQLGEQVGVPELRARAGVVTGDVAVTVGVIGEGVAGDTVNTAARVQTVATPGEVWVDEATQRLGAAAIGFTDRGEHQLKGKAEPLRLWSADRVLSGIGGSQRVDGLEAPMLGRDAELRLVKELFHATAERGAPRLVVVPGPAGVGKSRLGWEFEKYLDGLAGSVLWHRGRCLAYGEGVAFWALAEIVRQRLGIVENEAADVAAAKLAQGVAKFVTDADERDYIAARLSALIGVSIDGATPLGRDELFAGWRLFFERMADTEPVVLLVEDAQHADPGMLDFLDHLADWARDSAIFILVFTRPEMMQNRSGWGVGRNRTALGLEPLDAASMDALVEALVPRMPTDAREAITRQAQGIPLFAVETIRSLIDRDIVVPHDGVYEMVGDIGTLSVPDSLRGLLAARLDALDPGLRSLVADAAVLGAMFAPEALVAVSGRAEADVRAALAELLRREVLDVSADPLSPQRGSYAFTQILLRQVAYETLTRRDRKTRHLAVAAYLRATFPNDGDEVTDVLARHYLDALAAAPDDPDSAQVRGEAVATLTRAGERALRSGAPGNAAVNFATAAELLERSAEREADLNRARLWERASAADALGGDVDRVVRSAGNASTLYEQLGEMRAAARSRIVAGRVLYFARRYTEAREILAGVVAELRTDPDTDTVTAMTDLATISALTGGEDSDRLSAEALVLGQELGVDRGLLATLFTVRGLSMTMADRYDEAIAHNTYALELMTRESDGAQRARALSNLSNLLQSTDPRAAAEHARQAVELFRRIGYAALLGVAVSNQAQALLWAGDWNQADAVIASAAEDIGGLREIDQLRLQLAALRGSPAVAGPIDWAALTSEDSQDRAYVSMIRTLVAAADGNAAETVRLGREAIEFASIGIRFESIIWSWAATARAAHEIGDRVALDDLVAYLDAHPRGHLAPLLVAERSLVLARLADDDGASLAEAIAGLRRAGSPFHLAHGLLDHAEFLTGAGREDEARPLTEEARAIGEQLGTRLVVERAATVAGRDHERQPDPSSSR